MRMMRVLMLEIQPVLLFHKDLDYIPKLSLSPLPHEGGGGVKDKMK